ncbi:DUF4340 domain-containing protein [Aliiglaciecola lipolytica]|uniref:DUF4340 domain-containing protein n=1 Tax=Aliiglaciecola lipolytica E3 TaxID=1127673 RepID=K6XRU0_9ALTE|nr:DUF4340 domain-containing protein [Aliiglaciecola lipolytica]GAC14386.1 hypothetical protein GLIP_1753 [Aliiglaciecola lipolytica E3]
MNKQLISLLVIIVALVSAIYFLVIKADQQSDEKMKLFPELANQALKIQQIQLTRVNGELFNARQIENNWVTSLAERQIDYPLEQKALAELVESLSKATLFEAKTTKSENFERLGLRDIDQVDSQATLVELRTSTKNYRVLIGSQASLGQGSYVRLLGQQQTWLLDRVIALPSDQNAWLKQPILDISVDQVSFVHRLGESGFEIVRDAGKQGEFQLKNISVNQQLKYDSILSGFVDNLVNLKFEQIVKPEAAGFSPQAVTAEYEIGLQDGRIINLWLWQNEEQMFVRFEGDSGKYWYDLNYQLSSFSYGQISKVFSDFIQDKNSQIQEPQDLPIDEGESPN